jgi:hypothetical protein
MECGALDTNLSLGPGGRLVIPDDLLDGTVGDFPALAMAAVVARDGQVGRAAVIPLGLAASRMRAHDAERYERLFALIEESAFAAEVRDAAEALILTRFREAQIRDLVAELGGTIGPARQRYRAFLQVIILLTEHRISESAFLDEFLDFTRTVAGKLDFGIYAMCVERIFLNPRIPVAVKLSLAGEILTYPPLIRKELLTALLAAPAADPMLIREVRAAIDSRLTQTQRTEIILFTILKRSWQARRPAAAVPAVPA